MFMIFFCLSRLITKKSAQSQLCFNLNLLPWYPKSWWLFGYSHELCLNVTFSDFYLAVANRCPLPLSPWKQWAQIVQSRSAGRILRRKTRGSTALFPLISRFTSSRQTWLCPSVIARPASPRTAWFTDSLSVSDRKSITVNSLALG